MKINITKYKAAKAKQNLEEFDANRRRLVKVLVELSQFYGYRTIRKLLKYVKGEKIKGLPLRRVPTKKQKMGFKGHAISELNSYTRDRELTMLQELGDVSTEDLRWVLDYLSKSNIERRYSSRQFTEHDFVRPEVLPDIARDGVTLKDKFKREVEFNTDGRKLRGWLNRSKKNAAQREQERKARKKVERKRKRQRKQFHSARPRQTAKSYVNSILSWNKQMQDRYESIAHK